VRILIVEDNAAVRRVIAGVLAPLASTMAECTDGQDALIAYEAYRPDVVLMDLAMQRLDGLAATAAIIAAHPAARVVIVTNHADAGLRDAATRAGACGYLLKEHLTDLPALLSQLAVPDLEGPDAEGE
jgi:CheY-like chemotaxis protein